MVLSMLLKNGKSLKEHIVQVVILSEDLKVLDKPFYDIKVVLYDLTFRYIYLSKSVNNLLFHEKKTFNNICSLKNLINLLGRKSCLYYSFLGIDLES